MVWHGRVWEEGMEMSGGFGRDVRNMTIVVNRPYGYDECNFIVIMVKSYKEAKSIVDSDFCN